MRGIKMILPVKMSYGCDPELFLKQDGRIIGSEKVVPLYGIGGHVVRDGVQVELTPPSSSTIRSMGDRLSHAMFLLDTEVKRHSGVEMCWDGTVELSAADFDRLSPECRKLGCKPSENVYGDKPILVDKATYNKRSAGGHLHLGLGFLPNLFNLQVGVDERPNIVPILDIFVGNTMVLLDRDKGAAVRRENYGRAGEFRRPAHGLEYRTLSNFWLRSYTLMSLVFGLANFSISIADHTKCFGEDAENELLAAININNIVTAIDTNNFDLAMENFKGLIPFIQKYMPEKGFGLGPSQLDGFIAFANTVREYDGLEGFFDRDVVGTWKIRKFTEFANFL